MSAEVSCPEPGCRGTLRGHHQTLRCTDCDYSELTSAAMPDSDRVTELLDQIREKLR